MTKFQHTNWKQYLNTIYEFGTKYYKSENGKDEMDDIDRDTAAGLILRDEKSVNTQWEAICEADKNQELPTLLAIYMISGKKEYGERILELLKENAAEWYRKEIEERLAMMREESEVIEREEYRASPLTNAMLNRD